MVDREVLLEALSALCNSKVTSVQKQASDHGLQAAKAFLPSLSLNRLISTVLDGDEICPVSRSNYIAIQNLRREGGGGVTAPPLCRYLDVKEDTRGRLHIIDEKEFFDPKFDYDFTNLEDTQTFYRGEEVYERPCGWHRFALKVLNKYDENTWLGNQHRTTNSVPGEWPVSYHGTSMKCAEGIIEGHFKAGKREVFGRGVYSTPQISVAVGFSSTFTSEKNGKTYRVILQNRINPKYLEKHNDDKYWLVPIPKGTSKEEEQEFVERAIRPYGLLLQEDPATKSSCSMF